MAEASGRRSDSVCSGGDPFPPGGTLAGSIHFGFLETRPFGSKSSIPPIGRITVMRNTARHRNACQRSHLAAKLKL